MQNCWPLHGTCPTLCPHELASPRVDRFALRQLRTAASAAHRRAGTRRRRCPGDRRGHRIGAAHQQRPLAVLLPVPDSVPVATDEEILEEASGEATYYASKFDGRRTASGIVFSNSEAFAAHRTYPFGTVVRVTNTRNERSVILRVVDRGPNGTSENKRRTIIDVSQSAAAELDFVHAGRAPVRVEVLEWGARR